MAERWIVTALGKDRPGIVAGVTKVLYKLGCNLEDSAMTRLEGEFAIMLIFEAPASITEERLGQTFAPLTRELKLAIHVKQLAKSEAARSRKPSTPYIISVYGADRPGIVFQVSELLAKLKINISDVQTRRATSEKGRQSSSLYLLLIEIELPPQASVTTLEQRLHKLGKSLGVQVSLRVAETNVL